MSCWNSNAIRPFGPNGNHPVRLFIGSGMPTGLWKRVEEEFRARNIVEFFATPTGRPFWPTCLGAKIGSEGRHCPAAARRTRRL